VTDWIGLGYVATAVNASPDIIQSMGPIRIVAPQVCFGLDYPENDPDLVYAKQLIAGCRNIGLDVAGWGWCCNPNIAASEGAYHASVCEELGLLKFVANMEEPFDAHGNSSDARMFAPDYYAEAFVEEAPDVALGLTTTPRWGSSGNEMRSVGATIMPQAFTCEVPSATIPACVEHARSWGWSDDVIRPLVQVYQTNGVRPDPGVYNADAERYGVGVCPYILEQAFDGEGVDMIRTLAPSITRPPQGAPEPPEPIPPTPSTKPPDLPFKRALYPPDAKAKGKTPSVDGPDIVAVKRAISRAGYWKWQSFDDTYSNGFSHGKGPGIDSGMTGFQVAHVLAPGTAPTGWYGSATHEVLRTFILPTGPNTGQYAFDAKACELYRSA
jgi:hypothetical protein